MSIAALIFNLGGKFDKSYNEAAFLGAEAWVSETGGSYDSLEIVTEAQREFAVRRFAERDNSPIITVGIGFDDAVADVAPFFPDTSFVVIGAEVSAPNVTSILFDLAGAAEAAGYLAALASDTGRIGFVGGMATPEQIAAAEAYRSGAIAADPSVIVDIVMTGNTPAAWNDPVRGAELASAMVASGVDVLVSPSGGTSLGVLQYASDNGVRVIGMDMFDPGAFSDVMITSFFPRIDAAVFDILASGRPAPGTVVLDFESDGIGYLEDIDNGLFPTDLREAMEAFVTVDNPVSATEGADDLHGSPGSDMLSGLGGNDTITGNDGNDTLNGDADNDSILGGSGDDRLLGGRGNDEAYGNRGADTLVGGVGDDRLDGGIDNDSVMGEAGNDTIFGGPGFDTLRGGTGDDRVIGGDGRDLVYLGGGNDLFVDNTQGGANGRDTVFANAGHDTVSGGAGDDVFHGQGGNDKLIGRLGNDRLYGGNQNDTLFGGAGNDTVVGGNGRDRAYLGDGDDLWVDNEQVQFGDDFVVGGKGNDLIRMGGGNDTATGGAGTDTFVFASGINADTVTDFEVGIDALQVSSALWTGAVDQVYLDSISDTTSGSLVLDFGSGQSVTFTNLASNAGLLDDIVLF
ncbi:BMP family ABC transporter substrate-binding protein [Thetidibacter halocola]|uniref:BMP family ABC transporter substrate-binding protein n=1 Tax=Thetidibacter halocola TaxID=2827239 RepID=A0A8J7WGH2_9RHOB|nr:BMP family ABC transporter substrate-binding protein [Thetidibacter halocola]MBS0125256.1 BMP family ABC transporter substrate-binding protein [Thetidibacter halocola]